MNRKLFRSLLMFAWLTVGYAVVHGLVASWGILVWESIVQRTTTYENLVVFEEDGPLIQVSSRNAREVTYRRLDGSEVAGPVGTAAATFANFSHTRPGEPESWEHRLAALIDFQSSTVNWYLTLPPDRPGTAYFDGYEQLTGRHVGYLGVQGFSPRRPTVEQSFPFETSGRHPFLGKVVATQTETWYSGPFEPQGGSRNFPRDRIAANADLDAVWMLSRGNVYEIRLAARTVRKVIENRPEMRSLTRMTLVHDGLRTLQLMIRTNAGLLIVDPTTFAEQTIALEPARPTGYEVFYQLSNGERMFVSLSYSTSPDVPSTAEILWIGEQGQVERRTETEFSRGGTSLPLGVLGIAFPAPAISLAAGFISPLIGPRQRTEPESYLGRVGHFFYQTRIWLAISLIAGVATAWACRRRECDVFGNRGYLWPILVGVCGWFGWMGYICLRPLPAMTPHGEWLPARPEPNRPLGTEIFA